VRSSLYVPFFRGSPGASKPFGIRNDAVQVGIEPDAAVQNMRVASNARFQRPSLNEHFRQSRASDPRDWKARPIAA